jgi:hypothetical protein
VAPFGELKLVKNFTEGKTRVARIWQAIQKLDESVLRSRIWEKEGKLQAETPAPLEAIAVAPPAPEVAQRGTQR